MSYQSEAQIRAATKKIRIIKNSIRIPVVEEQGEDYRFVETVDGLHCITDPNLIWAWDEHMTGRYGE